MLPDRLRASAAVVTLTYQYGRAQVWLDDLTGERDPHGYDLCARHAAAPVGARSAGTSTTVAARRAAALPVAA